MGFGGVNRVLMYFMRFREDKEGLQVFSFTAFQLILTGFRGHHGIQKKFQGVSGSGMSDHFFLNLNHSFPKSIYPIRNFS